MYHDVIMAGIGGQGILVIGNLLAEAALAEGREVTFLPSYGVEMRGGQANCTVVIADTAIGSPSVNTPEAMIIMSKSARAKFAAKVLPGGLLVLNTSLVPAAEITRRDVVLMAFPFNDLAAELGNARLANMVAFGVYLGRTGVVKWESVEAGLSEVVSERNRKYIPQNLEAIRRGLALSNHGTANDQAGAGASAPA